MSSGKSGLKLVSLNRGHDPREFALVAFGGGGGLHAAALAAELGCRKVVIPRGAAVFSAWGMMMSDLRRDYFVTRVIDAEGEAASPLAALVAEVTAAAIGTFGAEGIEVARLAFRRLVRCRYQNQEHAVEIPLEDGAIDTAALAALVRDFHAAHEREYSYRLAAPVEIVGLHLVATAAIEKLAFVDQPVTGAALEAARKGTRAVDFAELGVHPSAIYDALRLEPGMEIDGPAIIEDPGTTIVLHPGNRATIDRFGNVQIDLGAGAAS